MQKIKLTGRFILCVTGIMLLTSCDNSLSGNISEQTNKEIVTPIEGEDVLPTLTPVVTLPMDAPDNKEQELTAAQKIIDGLMPSYNEMYKLLYSGIETGNEESITDNNGNEYLVLQNDLYTSVEDIRVAMEAVLTKEFIKDDYYNWVLDNDYPKYKEINGKLCSAMIDGMGFKLQSKVLEIEQKSDSEIILLMQWETNEGPENVLVTLKNIDGNWRIDNFN